MLFFSIKNIYFRNRNRIDNLFPFTRDILIMITHIFYKKYFNYIS